ncbi:MAG: autotransporter outer membrane beta-barrel domain-containing protein [Parasynechococcus sp.]
MALLVIQPADSLAQSCTPDPFGGEVCLPEPEKPDNPERLNKPKQTVIVPPCFGPCTQFPPAPPYRQFQEELVEEVAPQPTPVPTPVPTPEPTPAAPIRPLWFKSNQLDPVEAESYLERTLDRHDSTQLSAAGIDTDDKADAMVITVDGLRYGEVVDPHSLLFTNEVNEPGVNVWVRGFGGSSSNAAAGHRYANFSNGGSQLGFDIPISDETRIGLFGTYAVMNGSDGARGSWDADGWGGGAYAEYWTRDVYVRGMVSAGGYSGDHRRKIDGDTASGNRSGNSWTGVLNIGAPLQSGDWIIEPSALLSYTNTSLDKFSEHGADQRDRLRFHEMEVDQMGSELSLKFAIPIRDGERSLFLPSLRVGWAADWGMSGDHQKVSYLDSGKSQRWDVNGDDDHAALVELGLDYTTFNFNDTSMGVYARGGALIWAGDRGTSWQVQGGLSFKF